MRIRNEHKRPKGLPGLKALREAAGLNQSQLADKMGCRFGHVHNIENGRATGSPEFIDRLCAVLKCSYEDLRGTSGEVVAS